jgi:dihydroxy-acid dehydratase
MTSGIRRGLTRYGDLEFSGYLRKAFIKAMGYSDDALARPIVGITNTFSDFNPCHATVPQIIAAVKRGVMLAGALPMEFPTISIHESFAYPTSMYLRNLMALDTEEMIRAQPVDAVVLIGGCDKTIPAQLMAAASANVPAIVVPTGPMLTRTHRGERLGACTDCRRYWAKFRAGEIDQREIGAVNERLAPTAGTCMVMGTASTMACIAEVLGTSLPGAATIPAVHAERLRLAEASGARAAALATEELRPARDRRFHQCADPPDRDRCASWRAHRSRPLRRAWTQGPGAGRLEAHRPTLYGALARSRRAQRRVARARNLAAPRRPDGQRQDAGRRHRRIGNRSGPAGGAVIKHSSATPALLRHAGRAVVFDSLDDLERRIDLPELDVAADDVLVLRNAGPRGAPGMPEAGYIPIPKKLAQRGVKDMVRISDARMSGTAFGTIVLHVTPEAAAGGPLACVQNGDTIRLDVERRSIELGVSPQELSRRSAVLVARPPEESASGYRRLYVEHVLQADLGCDFDFMLPASTTGSAPIDP